MDLSSLSNQMVTAQTLGNLILAWPQENVGIQPQTKIYGGKAGTTEKFLFNYEGMQSIDFDDDIPDHYVEDNSAMQDHIALAPEIIKTVGFISELNNVTPEELTILKEAAAKLTSLSAYNPQMSVVAARAYNKAMRSYQAVSFGIDAIRKVPSFTGLGGVKTKKTTIINSGDSADNYISNLDLGSQNQQQSAFQKFYGYRKKRVLFTVQTPWAIFKDCAIKSMSVTQDEETNMFSTFSITFKPIRIAKTKFTEADVDMEGRAFNQTAPLQDSGMSSVDYRSANLTTFE